MSADLSISEPGQRILDDQLRVAIDLKCIQCGYNVRTLHDDGRCPECGNSVSETVSIYRQRIDRREWLRTACDGIGILLGGACFILPLLLLVSCMMISETIHAEVLRVLAIIAAIVALSGAVLVLVGLGQISRRDPADLESPKHWGVPSVLRACIWAIPSIPILGIMAGFARGSFFGNCATTALLAYLIIFPAAIFVRIAQLMRECDDEKTAAIAATMGLTTVLCEIAVVVGWYLNSQSPVALDFVRRATGVGLLLTTIATIVMLVRANRTAVAMIERIKARAPQPADQSSESG